jgi:hypothetical protein
MPLEVTRIDVYQAGLSDRKGSLAEKLGKLSEAGADLKFVSAHHDGESTDQAVLYVAGLKGAKQNRAARDAQFTKTNRISVIRVEGEERPGMLASVVQRLAEKGIDIGEVTTAATGGTFVAHVALKEPADAPKAMRALRSLE